MRPRLYLDADVVPVCVGWEDGRVYAVIDLKPWYPEPEA